MSWNGGAPSWGGDKNWMAIDKSGGSGDGFVYGTWQRFFSCCDPDTFTRSTDGGQTWTDVTPGTSPLPRREARMSWLLGNGVVLFGGKNATNQALADTWVWSSTNNSWTQQAPAQSPPARFGHAGDAAALQQRQRAEADAENLHRRPLSIPAGEPERPGRVIEHGGRVARRLPACAFQFGEEGRLFFRQALLAG